jgi:nitric oxide synthase oxygenase domain/subunit
MGQALVQAMKQALNHGDIVTSAFVFPPRQPNKPGPMLWNNNSLQYAGVSDILFCPF